MLIMASELFSTPTFTAKISQLPSGWGTSPGVATGRCLLEPPFRNLSFLVGEVGDQNWGKIRTLPEPHAAAILPGTSHVLRMTTPRATQARDELGLKARLPRDAP